MLLLLGCVRARREREAAADAREMGEEGGPDMALNIGEGLRLDIPGEGGEGEEEAGPLDLGRVERTIKEIQYVLANFNARRHPDRSRKEYLAQVCGCFLLHVRLGVWSLSLVYRGVCVLHVWLLGVCPGALGLVWDTSFVVKG
jgi:hypothetical protein